MKYVFAVTDTFQFENLNDTFELIDEKFEALVSRPYLAKHFTEKTWPVITKNQRDFFLLDSGAFSSWKSPKTYPPASIEDYIKVCKRVSKKIPNTICINLDVIPATFGRKPTRSEIDQACKDSMDHFIKMKEADLNVMPVFHQHDRWEYLDQYLEYDNPILGISPANDMTTEQRKGFLDRCFRTVKLQQPCHGLAATAQPLLERYPFYSCDSASAIFGAGIGQIYKFKNNKLITTHYTNKEKAQKHFLNYYADPKDKVERKKGPVSGRGYMKRRNNNIKEIRKLEKYITSLWEARGIDWSDHDLFKRTSHAN